MSLNHFLAYFLDSVHSFLSFVAVIGSHTELIQIWAFLINHIDKCPVLEDATTTKKVNIKGRQIRTKLYAFKMMMTMRYLLL